jgi:DNA transformation protein
MTKRRPKNAGEIFFGIVAADVLYLKTDETNRGTFERAGSTPFKPYPGRAMAMPYYSVPVATLENAETLVEWAAQAVAVAKAGRSSKPRARR